MAVFYHQFDKIMNLCKHSQSRIVCIYYYCRICILYTVMETTIPLHWCRKWKKTQYLTIPITSRQRVRISDGPHQNILSDTRRTTVDSKIVFDHKGNKREKMKGRFRATFKATGRVGSLLSFWLKSTLSYFPFYQLHCHGEDNVRNAAMFLNQCAYWKPGDLSAKDLQLLLKRCSNDLFLTRRCYLCAAHISFSPESGYLKFFFLSWLSQVHQTPCCHLHCYLNSQCDLHSKCTRTMPPAIFHPGVESDIFGPPWDVPSPDCKYFDRPQTAS